MKKRISKSAQFHMSFGMIFSIILIIVFLVFAFYAIRVFLGIQRTAETGKFLSDFQNDIDRVWRSAESSEREEYFLSSRISKVCLVDFDTSESGANRILYAGLKKAYFGSENLVFYPVDTSDLNSREIKNIDLAAITATDNPYCIEITDGKIQLTLTKDLEDALVMVKR